MPDLDKPAAEQAEERHSGAVLRFAFFPCSLILPVLAFVKMDGTFWDRVSMAVGAYLFQWLLLLSFVGPLLLLVTKLIPARWKR